MNAERVREAIRSLGSVPIGITDSESWSDVMSHPDVRDYLASCVTEEGFDASGVGILGMSRLAEENAEGVVPGGQLRKYGYVVVAISVGGNAVALSSSDGRVYWADHSSFSDDVEISYEDHETGEWRYSRWSAANVQKALVHLSDSIEEFFINLIAGRLEERLNELD